MSDISARALLLLLESARGLGYSLEETAYLPDGSRDPWARTSWSAMVRLVEDLAEKGASERDFERIGAGMVNAEHYRPLPQLARYVLSPEQLFKLATRMTKNGVFPRLDLEHEARAGQQLVRVGVPEPYRVPEGFFSLWTGLFAALPTLCDVPPATVHSTVHARHAEYRVVLATAPASWRSMRARAKRFFAPWRLIDEVTSVQESMALLFQELSASERDVRQLLDALPGGVLVAAKGQVVYANRALRQVAGDDLEALATRAGASPPLDVAGTDQQLVPAGTVHFEGAPASLFTLAPATAVPDVPGDHSSVDVAAVLTHELNNPLAYVELNLERIARLTDPGAHPHAVEALEAARAGLDRARMILRDTARSPEHEETSLVQPARAIENAAAMTGTHIQPAARLMLDLSPTPPVKTTEARLGQVLVNLLRNAAQAFHGGAESGNTIRVRLRSTDDEVRIEVEDNASGIPAPLRDKVFQSFVTSKAELEGTGLGLAICRNLVTRMGGRIWFESEEGRGTTFTVALPAASDEEILRADNQAGRLAPPDTMPPPMGRKLRVLVIDDEPAIGLALSDLLQEQHEVVVMSDGRDALDLLAGDTAFDVILCDLMMTPMSGPDLHAHLGHAQAELRERLVFMTGGAFTSEAREFLDSVDNACVEKPFRTQTLLTILDRTANQTPSTRTATR